MLESENLWLVTVITALMLTLTWVIVTARHRGLATRRAEFRALAQAQVALRDQDALFRAVVENSGDLVSIIGPDGTAAYLSGAFPEITGYSTLDEVPRTGLDSVHEQDLPRVQAALVDVLSQPGKRNRLRYRVRHPDGSLRWVETTARNAIDIPAINGVVATTRDVDDSARAERLVTSQARILKMIAAGLPLGEILDAIAAEVGEHLVGSRCAVQLIGPDRRLVIAGVVDRDGLPCALMEGRVADRARTICGTCLATGEEMLISDPVHREPWRTAPCLRTQSVGTCWTTPIRGDLDTAPVGLVSCVFPGHFEPDSAARQVVDSAAELAAIAVARKRFEEELSHRALHDPLTGLANRTLLLERLGSDIERSHRHPTTGALLFMDIDHFKRVNDSLGHHAGDRVLCEIAKRLVAHSRAEDTVARIGGDEFVVLCPEISGEASVVPLAERLLQAVNEPLRVHSHELRLTASIGIAVRRPNDRAAETLVRRVDAAMYRAKERGRDRWEIFDTSMRKRTSRSLRTLSALRRAVEDDLLEVWYQPVWSIEERGVVAVEALLRWRRADGVLIPPSEFVPLAEESGLIGRIGARVLQRACEDLCLLDRSRPGRRLVMSVNASGRQLIDGSLVPAVRDALSGAQAEPKRLLVELTESALLTDTDAARHSVRALQRMGVGFALDDFGTGYSSLSLVKEFPGMAAIKIDRSFMGHCSEPRSIERSVIQACVALSSAHGARVIAEGVETVEQLEALQNLGVDDIQGYLVAPAMPLAELLTWLLEERWRGSEAPEDGKRRGPRLRVASAD